MYAALVLAWVCKRARTRSDSDWCGTCRILLGDCGRNLDSSRFEIVVLLNEVMWQRRVKESVDIQVVLDQEIVAGIILSSGSH